MGLQIDYSRSEKLLLMGRNLWHPIT